MKPLFKFYIPDINFYREEYLPRLLSALITLCFSKDHHKVEIRLEELDFSQTLTHIDEDDPETLMSFAIENSVNDVDFYPGVIIDEDDRKGNSLSFLKTALDQIMINPNCSWGFAVVNGQVNTIDHLSFLLSSEEAWSTYAPTTGITDISVNRRKKTIYDLLENSAVSNERPSALKNADRLDFYITEYTNESSLQETLNNLEIIIDYHYSNNLEGNLLTFHFGAKDDGVDETLSIEEDMICADISQVTGIEIRGRLKRSMWELLYDVRSGDCTTLILLGSLSTEYGVNNEQAILEYLKLLSVEIITSSEMETTHMNRKETT